MKVSKELKLFMNSVMEALRFAILELIAAIAY